MRDIEQMKTAINCFEAEIGSELYGIHHALECFDDKALLHLMRTCVVLRASIQTMLSTRLLVVLGDEHATK